MKNYLPVISMVMTLTSCTIDQNEMDSIYIAGQGGKGRIVRGDLVINEFEARGSGFFNELNLPGNSKGGSDWIEIYNTTNDTILLENGRWFITDTPGEAEMFQLPELNISPKGFLVIWCDGKDTTITQIHTNFSLNKSGEYIGLFYRNYRNDLIKIDGFRYYLQQDNGSTGRLPDGSENFKTFNNPTPGFANSKK